MSNVPKYTVIIHDLSTDAAVETLPANNYHDAVRIMEGASLNPPRPHGRGFLFH